MLSQGRLSDPMDYIIGCHTSLSMESSGKNTGLGSHFLLQGIFPIQGLNWVSCIAGRFFTIWTRREAPIVCIYSVKGLSYLLTSLYCNEILLTFLQFVKGFPIFYPVIFSETQCVLFWNCSNLICEWRATLQGTRLRSLLKVTR